MPLESLPSLRPGQLADAAGVNLQTVRYYERRGLLKPQGRRPSGYREYSPEAVKRLRFIKRAQALGFSLREIRELLALNAATAGRRERARKAVAGKLAEIDAKIRDLRSIRETLLALADACECGRVSGECPILSALEGPGEVGGANGGKPHALR